MAWDIVYYRTPTGAIPGLDFLLKTCPKNVSATIFAVLDAVAEAPPPRFSGGGMWEAMHGDMSGFYEVRKQGAPNRSQYRLFCLLENAAPEELKKRGLAGPAIAVITGLSKPWMTGFTDAEYSAVRSMGSDYLKTIPRRIGQP